MENSGTIERFCDSAVPRLRLHLYRPSDAIHSCMRKKGNRNSFRKPSFHLALYGWNTRRVNHVSTKLAAVSKFLIFVFLTLCGKKRSYVLSCVQTSVTMFNLV